MRNLIKSILVFFISFYSVNTFAATGAATEYKVTMTKLELCETGSTTSNCLNALTISPTGTSGAVDIASVNAGATAGVQPKLVSLELKLQMQKDRPGELLDRQLYMSQMEVVMIIT